MKRFVLSALMAGILVSSLVGSRLAFADAEVAASYCGNYSFNPIIGSPRCIGGVVLCISTIVTTRACIPLFVFTLNPADTTCSCYAVANPVTS